MNIWDISPVQKSYASVARRAFNSVETETMFTWIENTEKPIRLTVKHKDKIIAPSYKTSSSLQTATTHVRLTTIGALKTDCVYPSKQCILNTGINSEQAVHTKTAITGP
jgi:hypothetical protein